MNTTKTLLEQLTAKIEASYTEGVTVLQAERLAGEFLAAQLSIAHKLQTADLDARMRKSGVKALRAGVYMEAATKTDKKPSDVMLEAIVNKDKMVQSEQDGLDTAEVERATLERYYDIFLNAHIFFRGIAKGSFGG